MKNILLPTDFSENSWNAINYAINFCENSKCNFYVLNVDRLNNAVLNDAIYISADEVIEDIYVKQSKQKLRALLKRIAAQITHNDNHHFYTLTDNNFFIESIRKHVDEKKIDLIVMGTKGASGFHKFILGSNTGDVITKVQCTTLAVPENTKFCKLKEIAFPTDFSSSYDIEVLNPISKILENHKASLRIVHICKKNSNLNTDQEKNKELLEDYFNHFNMSFHFLTNKKVEDAMQCFVESRNIDMICMVAKNLNYFQQILFHSKVEEINYHTDVPFLVMHE